MMALDYEHMGEMMLKGEVTAHNENIEEKLNISSHNKGGEEGNSGK